MLWNGEEIDTYYVCKNKLNYKREENNIDKKEDLTVELIMYKTNYRENIAFHIKYKTFLLNQIFTKGAFWLVDEKNNNIAFYGYFSDVKEVIKNNTSILYLTFTSLYPFSFTYKFYEQIKIPSANAIRTPKFRETNYFLLISDFVGRANDTSLIYTSNKYKYGTQSIVICKGNGYINSIKQQIYPTDTFVYNDIKDVKFNSNYFLNGLYIPYSMLVSFGSCTLKNAHLFIIN